MKVKTYLYCNGDWNEELDGSMDSEKTLLILFGTVNISKIQSGLDDILKVYPRSTVVGCSSAGEIYKSEIYDDALTLAVVKFEKSSFKLFDIAIDEQKSYEVGVKATKKLQGDNLKSLLMLSDVSVVDGTELAKGITENLPQDCSIMGGLAGNGVEFDKTWILADKKLLNNHIVIVALYGNDLNIKHSCRSGWRRFGIDRKVTGAEANVLYTLDNKPALELYKRYLGEHASALPASSLYFPLMINSKNDNKVMFRAIKAIDEEKNSITLAGGIEQGDMVSFAVASFDDLVDSAEEAASDIKDINIRRDSSLCLSVSCVARRAVLKQQTEDELEAVVENLGYDISMVGFYSYGEFSKCRSGCCDFHNQSITINCLYES